jgi:DNA (cytosine-5)-methyltransferase 1
MRIALAAELDRWAHKTYATNHPEIPPDRVLCCNLTSHNAVNRISRALSTEPNLVLIIGGPPCQKVSLVGTTGRYMATSKYARFDRRRGAETYIAFRDIVRAIRTRFFVMENVPGLFAANDGTACQDILNDFADLYATAHTQVDAYEHGVPQRRKRILIVGVLKGRNPRLAGDALAFLLEKLGTPLGHAGWIPTFGEAVSDLPPLEPSGGAEFGRHPLAADAAGASGSSRTAYQLAMQNGSNMIINHIARPNNERDIKLYALLKPGEVGADAHHKYNRPDLMIYRNDIFLDKYRRQVWDAPSTTIVAHLARDGHMFIHPKQVRSITVREAARLQSFPDDFIFLGPRTEQFRQVGNAVPPLLGARIRTAVLETLRRFYPGERGG